MAGDDGAGIRWRRLVPLSVTVMCAFGTMFYGFSVYLTDEAAGSEFSTSVLSLAYSGAVLVSGLLAMPVGRFADRRGVRQIIGWGSFLGFLGLAGFSLAQEPWQVVGAWWVFVGPAGALTFYEPAMVAVDQWCTARQRPRALGALTVIGGLAGVVFIPGGERLAAVVGWRPAAALLGLLLLVVGGSTALWAIPGGVPGPDRSDAVSPTAGSLPRLVGDRRFVLYSLAMMLAFFAAQSILAHRVALFDEAGFSVATVALWAGVASALSLPGRWLAPLLAGRWRAARIQAGSIGMVLAATVLMLNARGPWQMIGHFLVFGLAFGALLPLRAMIMADWHSGSGYGRIMGTQWTGISLAGAVGPVVTGVIRDHTGSYSIPVAVLGAAFAVALVLTALVGAATEVPPPSDGTVGTREP